MGPGRAKRLLERFGTTRNWNIIATNGKMLSS